MRNAEFVNPFDGNLPEMRQEYGSNTELGRIIRREDAKQMLQRMDAVEQQTSLEEGTAIACACRIEEQMQLHRISIEYRLHFGVAARERHAYRLLLQQIAEHGGLTLREASRLAAANTPPASPQRKGSSACEGGGVASPESSPSVG